MSGINLNGGSKKIILNGTTYFAGGVNGGSPTPPTPTEAAIERLCDVVYVGHDAEEYPVIDTDDSTFDENYDEYLSYDSTTKKFTVLQEFTALLIPWTFNYDTASGSYSHGEFYINDTKVKEWRTDYKSVNYYAGVSLVHSFSEDDTFYNYTPASDGYPQQMLKVYKIDSSLATLFEDMFTFNNESGGVGRVIT